MKLYEDADVNSLIIESRSKDDSAFRELVRRYTPMMKKAILSFSEKSAFEYDELFSEACVGLHLAVESFDLEQDEVTFGIYARACIYHRLVDLVRSLKSRLQIVDVDMDSFSVVSDPESVIVDRERFESLLREASTLLSEYEYKVLMLHIQGYKTAKIAQILSKSSKSVDNAKGRLFKRLRDKLGSAF